MYKVYIYGAGHKYNLLSSYLQYYKEIIKVLGVITSEESLYSKIDGHDCISIAKAAKTEFDYIIIACDKWKEIRDIIAEYGVCDEKIILSSVFENPGFNFFEYIKLKKSNISIISNCCIDGFIYNKLGLKMMSPTINIGCNCKTLMEFVNNIEYYCEKEMVEYINEDGDTNIERFWPKGIIDSKLIWMFRHEISAKDGIDHWNKRKGRINKDNIAVIMILYNDSDIKYFNKIRCEKKLGIYYKKIVGMEDNLIISEEWNDYRIRSKYHYNWIEFVNRYLTGFNNNSYHMIDWIKFLNGEKDFKRYI